MGAMSGRRDDAVAIVNGLFGDTLDGRASRLATPMTMRAGSIVLPLDRDAPPDALADAMIASGADVSGRVCVLVHGLMSTESIWRFPGDPSATYGSLLADDHDVTVLSLRYNSGRHVSANGRDLADLLDRLVQAWPVRLREINLIGHSMGGLVVRSALHHGRSMRPSGRRSLFVRRWTGKVRRIVLIGVPNNGAGLEALVHSASLALGSLRVPGSRLVGRGLDRRSAGIKSLRLGSIYDDGDVGFGGRWRRPPRHRPLRRADYLVIAGSVTADPEHPVGRVLGDALVTSSSAAGLAAGRALFPGATVRTFPKVTHNALAHHPDVYDAITEWW
jgi:pimeloyl-ACP methyl ester carboxylesterase